MTNTTDQIVKIACDVILERDGKVLMGKRLNAVGAGSYGMPGGHLEFGESLQNCAKRELLEETGLIAEELEFVAIVSQPQTVTPQHYVHFVFKCSRFKGEPVNIEPDRCEGWEWFDINNLPANIFASQKDFIPMYLSKKVLLD
jgi:8-oxo-dGTP diphosphatase